MSPGDESASAPAGPRVLVVTDSDSYVKYGASLGSRLPDHWPVRLVVTRSTVLPSERQRRDAVDGTRFEGLDLPVVGPSELQAVLRDWRPDVVLAAARGYTVQALVSLVPNTPDRPVLVSGLAGIAIPVLPFGLGFRRSMDVFVVHSHRELREFARASARLGVPHGYELATLPFLERAAEVDVDAGPRDRIVFAAQAQVPRQRRDRDRLLDRLVDAARAHPDLLVVVKVRGHDGEPQTHHEAVSFPQLLAERDDVPANLVVESGPMRAQLRRAVGFVTVSSTALLEAVAAGVPSLALDDFGVGAEQINLVLEGSGLLGPSDDLVAGHFHHVDPAWAADNYLHDPADDTWVGRVEELLEQRATIGLLPYRTVPVGIARRVRHVLYRTFAFAPASSGPFDLPERMFIGVARRVSRSRWYVTRLVRRAADDEAPGREGTEPGAGEPAGAGGRQGRPRP